MSLIDMYPTLVDLCALPARQELEGISLRALIENPGATWERPAVMTFGCSNHAVWSERYRYIRYDSGEEELHDHSVDPGEWTNLAGTPAVTAGSAQHAQWLPKANAPRAALKNAFIFDPDTYT